MSTSPQTILFIEPPFFRLFKNTFSLDRYPLGLGYLAETVRKESRWNVLVYNSDYSGHTEHHRINYLTGEGFDTYLKNLKNPDSTIWSEIKENIARYRPRVIGVPSRSQNFASACQVARIAKQVDPVITVVAGGPHATVCGRGVLVCSDIDVVVRGEGELTVVELLKAIGGRRSLEGIKGIIYRDDGRIVENPPRDLIKDLDALPFPHENAQEVLKDCNRYPVSAFRYVCATRGCPHNCIFCGSRCIWGGQVRFRSPENVVLEIQSLRNKGVRFVHFSDDTFGVNREYLKKICNALLMYCPGLQWSCETHVSLIDEDTVPLMKRAGCHSIEIGIESGNNEMLRRIRKNITIEQALAACDTIKKNGIEVVALFMVGFPDETEQTLADTFNAMKQARCDRVHFSIFTPYAGSDAYELCKERGLIGEDYDPSLYGHQSPMNYFCKNITPERFRQLVAEMEKVVDRKNFFGRTKGLFTSTGVRRMRELGFRESSRKVLRFFFGK